MNHGLELNTDVYIASTGSRFTAPRALVCAGTQTGGSGGRSIKARFLHKGSQAGATEKEEEEEGGFVSIIHRFQ